MMATPQGDAGFERPQARDVSSEPSPALWVRVSQPHSGRNLRPVKRVLFCGRKIWAVYGRGRGRAPVQQNRGRPSADGRSSGHTQAPTGGAGGDGAFLGLTGQHLTLLVSSPKAIVFMQRFNSFLPALLSLVVN